ESTARAVGSVLRGRRGAGFLFWRCLSLGFPLLLPLRLRLLRLEGNCPQHPVSVIPQRPNVHRLARGGMRPGELLELRENGLDVGDDELGQTHCPLLTRRKRNCSPAVTGPPKSTVHANSDDPGWVDECGSFCCADVP